LGVLEKKELRRRGRLLPNGSIPDEGWGPHTKKLKAEEAGPRHSPSVKENKKRTAALEYRAQKGRKEGAAMAEGKEGKRQKGGTAYRGLLNDASCLLKGRKNGGKEDEKRRSRI